MLDGEPVSAGHLRVDRLPVEAVLDVVDGFEAMLRGDLKPDPAGTRWLLGAPTGRLTVAARDSAEG